MYGLTSITGNVQVTGSIEVAPGNPVVSTEFQAREAVLTPIIESTTGTLTINSNTIVSGSVDVVAGVSVVATQFEAREAVITPIIESSTGTVEFGSVIQLPSQDPLPTGAVGQLAVSASNLYYHNGTSWSQIN